MNSGGSFRNVRHLLQRLGSSCGYEAAMSFDQSARRTSEPPHSFGSAGQKSLAHIAGVLVQQATPAHDLRSNGKGKGGGKGGGGKGGGGGGGREGRNRSFR